MEKVLRKPKQNPNRNKIKVLYVFFSFLNFSVAEVFLDSL